MFPVDYLHAIETYLSTASTKLLKSSFDKLSYGYRSLQAQTLGSTKEDVDAYLVGRLPLTFSVLSHLLELIKPFFSDRISILDYGSGPGTALLALAHVWDGELFSYHGLEQKKAMLEAAYFFKERFKLSAYFHQGDVMTPLQGQFDLAIVSYVLNELLQQDAFFEILFKHESILVIEPGTPDGTDRILALRQEALKRGFHVVLPCPHNQACPLQKPGWCHFFQRVERFKLLKSVKSGLLGYEDEKYSFVFLSKSKTTVHQGVIVDKPKVFPYGVSMNVCSKNGCIEKVTILKKDKQDFKRAKKCSWGDFV
jgi:ribosomal protein RSM22 (predicted rRNA methylase)